MSFENLRKHGVSLGKKVSFWVTTASFSSKHMAVFVSETCVKIRIRLPIPAESSALFSGIYLALNNTGLSLEKSTEIPAY